VFFSPELAKQGWLRHGFGTRGADPDLGVPLVRAKQVHSDVIHVVDREVDPPRAGLKGDALITATTDLGVAVATADCLPLVLADPEHRVVAAVHAGWRGTLKRIAEKTVGLMTSRFGSKPAKLLAAMGPSIHVECYEVGMEVVDEFRSQFSHADELFQKIDPENPALVMLPRQHLTNKHAVMRDLDTQRAYLNVEEANARQLLDAGLSKRNIARGAPCTACRLDLLHSFRKEGRGQGHQLSAIGIVKD
jgi:YfiH family protein